METFEQWTERKSGIEKIFRETRKSGMLFPIDIKDDTTPEEINYIVDSELSYMTFIRHALESYLEKKTQRKDFNIKVQHSPTRVGEHFFRVNVPTDENDENTLTILHKSDDNFERQLAIAEACALIALAYVPYIKKSKYPLTLSGLLHFTRKLLKIYAGMDNGAILRDVSLLSDDEDITRTIRKIHPEFDFSEPENKDEIDSLANEIFPDDSVAALNCEKKIVEEYTKNKYSDTNKYPDIRNFKIKITSKPLSYDKPYGRVSFHHNSEMGKIGCVIVHIAQEEMKVFLNSPEHNAPNLNLTPKDAQKIIRLIVAHEFAHIVLSYEYGKKVTWEENRTQEMERDAFYFARLLLDHREFLYFSEKNSLDYCNAQNIWKELIRYVYGMQSDCVQEYLNWVIES